ncbi:uncharacterized protein [Parasteatoda tepidariorum]|uniref:uncharacterized protein n=1 Tax=Parasteatoda tepidariorum TaxID=114398 RepID=UPI0039BC4BCB
MDLLDLTDSKSFLFLNDGTATHSSFSYSSTEELDVTFASSDIFPSCSWKVLDSVGSDHLPILVEININKIGPNSSNYHWNFGKANWQSFEKLTDQAFINPGHFGGIETCWFNFKQVIIHAAKQSILRGRIKKYTPYFTHCSESLKPLIEERNRLHSILMNKHVKPGYGNLPSALENINRKERTQTPFWNIRVTFLGTKGPLRIYLGDHYSKTSLLSFSRNDKITESKARRLVHGCRNSTGGNHIWQDCFSFHDLDLALKHIDPSKLPRPDDIFGHMLTHLGPKGRQQLLTVFNLSWKNGRLPRDWRRALVIPIRKPGRPADSSESCRPKALTSIPCKIVGKMILSRLTYHLQEK